MCFVDDKVKRYAVDVVSATRDPAAAGMRASLRNLIENGASPRASINLVKVAKAHALLARPHLRVARTTSSRSRTMCCATACS